MSLHFHVSTSVLLLSLFVACIHVTALHSAVISDDASPSSPSSKSKALMLPSHLLRRGGGGSRGGERGGGSRPRRPRHPSNGRRTDSNDCNDSDCTDNSCFPDDAYLTTPAGPVQMRDATIGTQTSTARGSASAIFVFSHRETDSVHPFLRITTCNGSLTLSAGHRVYTAPAGAVVASRELRVGDSLQLASGSVSGSGWRQFTHIVSIERVWRRGLYNPHTLSGELVVDGFRVSCYTDRVTAPLSRALLAPLRAFFRVSGFDLSGTILWGGSPLLHSLI